MYKSFFFLTILLYSCGGGTGSTEPARETITGGTYEEKIYFPFNLPKAKENANVEIIRSKFKDLINLRRDNLTSDLFDLTYNFVGPYGFANLKRGGGLYHYSEKDGFLMLLDDDKKVEPRLFSIQYNAEFYNFIGRPIMFINDGHSENMLLANWSNDAFLETVTITHRIENGMQIMMKMLDEQPVTPAG